MLRDLPAEKPVSPHELVELQKDGALLIDARSAAEFAVAHIPGSINAGLGASFPIWAGWLAPYDRQVVLILPSDECFGAAKTELHRIGVDAIAGYLEGGLGVWCRSGLGTEMMPEMSIDELAIRVASVDGPLRVLDVRDPVEWNSAHIPGSINVSAGDIARGELPDVSIQDDDPVAVNCNSGYRASLAASLLAGRGIQGVRVVPGGMAAWAEAGLPTYESGGSEGHDVRTALQPLSDVTAPARNAGKAMEDVSEMTRKLVGPWNSSSQGRATPETTVDELVRERAEKPVQVVDVREPEEWTSGCIPGSVLMSMGDVQERYRELDPALPVVTVCHSGVRSLFSAEELIAAGFADVRSLSGGMVAWVEAGHPVSPTPR